MRPARDGDVSCSSVAYCYSRENVGQRACLYSSVWIRAFIGVVFAVYGLEIVKTAVALSALAEQELPLIYAG